MRFTGVALTAAAMFTMSGCGGSMAGSSSGWILNGFTVFGGDPMVTILPTTGGTTAGTFTVTYPTTSTTSTTPTTATVNTPIFLEADFAAEVPNVNSSVYTSTAPQPIGVFSAEWSQVLPSSNSTPTAVFSTTTGTTFTGQATSAPPNVRLSGIAGNFVTVYTTGPITFKLHVTLSASDGSTKSNDFYVTVNTVASTSSGTATPTPTPSPSPSAS